MVGLVTRNDTPWPRPDAGLYKVRPSHEDFLIAGFGWKRESKCVVQHPSGSPKETTPGLIVHRPLKITNSSVAAAKKPTSKPAVTTTWGGISKAATQRGRGGRNGSSSGGKRGRSTGTSAA